MPDNFTCKQIAQIWRMKSATHAGGQAWPAFREKLKRIIATDPDAALRLFVALQQEAKHEREQHK